VTEPRRLPPPFFFALLALAVAPALHAVTYVRMTDSSLVDASPLIVRGTVLGSAAHPADGSTHTRIAIDEVLKGAAVASPLVVRVPGYETSEESLLVPGAPRFARGERVLLFLAPRRDGTWGIEQFLLGAFHEIEPGAERLAVRGLAGAIDLSGTKDETARSAERFAAWIRDRARGRSRAVDYLVAGASSLRRVTSDYTLLGTARWQVFDSAGDVPWEFQSAGWDGAGAGASAFSTARAAWNSDADTPVQYSSGGSTSSVGAGLGSTDGHDRIIFGDPNNEISGTFNCGTGGVVAIGGYNTAGSHVFHGVSYGTISEGDIVVQDGVGCFLTAHPGADAEVFAHELGHTLGLGHSADPAALMFPSAGAPYGATLGADDRAGLCFLYGSSCPSGPPPPAAPSAPSALVATATSSSQVHLTWSDNSSNETSFRIEVRTGAASFADVGSVGGNSTGAIVSGLSPATLYDFRVRARNGSGDSPYTNIASATTLAGSGPPLSPSGLQASALSATSILLSWQDVSGNESEFRIERLVGATFIDIGGAPANVTMSTVIGLAPSTLYTFRVKARNGGGDSLPSNQASATTLAAAVTAPLAPSSLAANPTSATTVHLSWIDGSSNEDSFRIEAQSGGGGFTEIATAAANSTSADVANLAAGTAYQFRVRARNAAGDSPYSNVASAHTPALCGNGDPDVVCLNGGRFEAKIDWKTPDGQTGTGHPVSLSGDVAYFWFFLPTNIEVVAKVLDGCSISQSYWVFATGLTNVETHLTVKDTLTQQVRTYGNAQGQPFQPLQDTGAFLSCGGLAAAPAMARLLAVEAIGDLSAASCSADELCPQAGRFRVEAFWKTPAGASGQGHAVALTADSGYFWFFDESNIELVVKVLDACSFAHRYWVFAGGLTNVEVRLRVTDTSTGAVKEYVNPLNQAYLPLQDADAFATCP
jgi:hypothetical protein